MERPCMSYSWIACTRGIAVAGFLSMSLFASAVSAATAASAANEWPRFRGPNGNGQAEPIDLPAAWTDQDVRWKTTLPARGHSSPVVWGNKIFVTCADQESGKRMIIGVDAANGGLLWTHAVEGSYFRQHADNNYASSTPAVDAKHVYVVWAGPDGSVLIALDHDGKSVWSAELGIFKAQHGAGASPIVAGGLVVLPFEQDGPGPSFVVAFDAMTGKERWRLPRTTGKLACSTPCLYEPVGAAPQLVLTSSVHGMYAVDPATGKLLWEMADVFKQRCVGSPLVVGDVIIADDGTGASGTRMVAVRPPIRAGEPAKLLWQATQGVPYVPCPVARGEYLFFVTDAGVAVCVRVATGEELWRKSLGVGTFYGSPIVVGERIYVVSRHGEVVAFSASEQFNLFGTSKLGDGSFATPAVANGRMFLRTFSSLIAVGAK
jgi:outer membrane protein assembly factor BamB